MNMTGDGRGIGGVLVDLAGVVYQGDALLPGAARALSRLKERIPPVRYLTNTTRSTRRSLVDRLVQLGLTIDEVEVFSAPQAARQLLQQRGLRPLLLCPLGQPHLSTHFSLGHDPAEPGTPADEWVLTRWAGVAGGIVKISVTLLSPL